mmetsp:Transcript_12679/g.11236  ORF Transcript_12679/g.11236 Transcript_12679/m.11236 type:complete len:278 (+) Transcript_12679:259-1092(+)
MKIKGLENENFRLQNLIINYRNENMEKVDTGSNTFLNKIKENKDVILGQFETIENKDKGNKDLPCFSQYFHKNIQDTQKKHKKFLDCVFELIINHPYPVTRFKYWKYLNTEYSSDYQQIKKLDKLTKYQISELVKDNKISGIDKYVASLSPNKMQFNCIKNIWLKKEFKIREEFKEGITLLLKAKGIFEKGSTDLCGLLSFCLKSNIITDEQVLNSQVRDTLTQEEDAFRNIWDIKIEPKVYEINFGEDPIYKKISKKYLKKEERHFKGVYNNYSIT